jgi:hypothetical protein
MSMKLSVYVGPSLVAEDVSQELIESFEHVIRDGEGEARDHDDTRRYLTPNIKVPGITRTMRFDDCDYPRPTDISMDLVRRETEAFRNMTSAFRDAMSIVGGECTVEWGIVCGIF